MPIRISRKNQRTIVLSAVALMAALLSPCIAAGAEDDDDSAIVKQVRADWEKRRTRTQRVRYRAQGSVTIPKGQLIQEGDPDAPRRLIGYPFEDYTYPHERLWLIDFEHGKLRVESRSPIFDVSTGEWHPRYNIDGFNGAQFWTYQPKKGQSDEKFTPPPNQPELTIQPATRAAWAITQFDQPLLLAHGLSLPARVRFDKEVRRKWAAARLPLQRIGAAVLNGRECEIVKAFWKVDRNRGYDQFWVDLKRESAVLRWERHLFQTPDFEDAKPAVDVLFCRTDVEYAKTKHGWLPQSWSLTDYLQPDTPNSVMKARVVERSINGTLDGSRFEMPRPKGVLVENRLDDKFYQMGADGSLIPPLSENRPNERGGGDWRWWMLLILLSVAALTGIFVYRKYHRKAF